MKARIIAIAHHAGGVGKTTTSLNLGYALAQQGRRVLLADLDPQGDLSLRLGELPGPAVLGRALLDKTLRPARWPYHWDGVGFDVILSDLESMAGVELQLAGVQMREQQLARILSTLQYDYDMVLLDCPPALNLLTVNALYAADSVLIPVQAQDKAVRQLAPMLSTLAEVQSYRHGLPTVLGLLLTMADNTRQAQEAEQDLRSEYANQVFQVTIPRRTALADDSRYQAPIGVYAPMNSSAAAYAALAEEVIARDK